MYSPAPVVKVKCVHVTVSGETHIETHDGAHERRITWGMNYN
jgi:hypothetical protein